MAARSLFAAALIAGISYYFADAFTTAGPGHLVWKTAGVGLLALWAATQARSADGWLIAAVLALGAAGDALIEVYGLAVGGGAFLAGHLVAATLYLRNRRLRPSTSQVALALALLVATPLIAWLLPADRAGAVKVAVYAGGLGAMAATAWLSRFPRYRVGLGAMLFVVSDLLIFASVGPLAHSQLPDILVWPLYFAGQALIARGVVTTLRGAAA